MISCFCASSEAVVSTSTPPFYVLLCVVKAGMLQTSFLLLLPASREALPGWMTRVSGRWLTPEDEPSMLLQQVVMGKMLPAAALVSA